MSVEFLPATVIVCLAPGIGLACALSATPGPAIATPVHQVAARVELAGVPFPAIRYAGAASVLFMARGALNGRAGLRRAPGRV